MYRAIREKLNSKPTFILSTEKPNLNKDVDYYGSLFYYTEDHVKKYTETGTLSGIKDTLTNKIYFDLDSKTDLNLAKSDTIELVNRLEKMGITKENYRVSFSGSKGFNVEFEIDKFITPNEFKDITFGLAKDLKTFDTVVNDPNRVVRLINSKHQSSGLYKIPLLKSELQHKQPDEIKEMAKQPREIKSVKGIVSFKDKFNNLVKPQEKPKEKVEILPTSNFLDIKTLDWSLKPRDWKDYKWALLQGYFKEGDRHNALMVIAATCRGLGYDKETTYYMCKSALKKQARHTGQNEFAKDELWENIIDKSVFSANWNGGQYSILNSGFLKKYCEEMGFNQEGLADDEESTHTISDVYNVFEDYATNLDKLTIKFGIPELDKKMRATVGMSMGLIAAPGVGKTSLALAALNFMSKSGELCVFFSYDMYHAIVYQKLVQRHFSMTMDEILLKITGKKTVYKEEFDYTQLIKAGRKVLEETEYTATFDFSDKKEKGFGERVNKVLQEEYANVEFCFTAGQTVEDIDKTIDEVERKRGKKVRFIAIDYNELVQTNLSDSTASSNYVAQKLRELAIVKSICVFQLFQPTKLSGTPADEIKSYNSAKGGGGIAQSVSIMLTMSRPGYSPDHPEDDQYVRINCVKNRLGQLFKVDLKFHGLTGGFSTMTEEDRMHLEAIINHREEELEEQNRSKWDL